MKIASSVLIAFVSGVDVDGTTVHLNGCIWPESGVLNPKISYADDPYAQFTNLAGTGLDAPYTEGTQIQRRCPTTCEYDGTNYINCSGYWDSLLFECGFKDGKNNRSPGRHFVFKDGSRNKNIALFFRTALMNKYRPVPPNKLCPKPTVTLSDPDSVCGDKPAIPTKDDVRFAQFTHWSADGLSVVCTEDAKPIRANNYEQLSLVCDRQKPTGAYKWYHQSPNGRLRPAGNRWLKSRYLCRFCHDCQDETSGDEPAGSGGDSPDNADVDM